VISQLVREEADPLVQHRVHPVRFGGLLLIAEFGDGYGDGVIQAAIQRAELVDLDRGGHFERQVGDRLAEVAVVVHDLVHRESMRHQLAPVPHRAFTDLGSAGETASCGPGNLAAIHRKVGLLDAERLDELVEEDGYAKDQHLIGRGGHTALGDLQAATVDQRLAIGVEEFMEHSPSWTAQRFLSVR
jgi:hypothetical protein